MLCQQSETTDNHGGLFFYGIKKIYLITVSYTHLDVYKRQGMGYVGAKDIKELQENTKYVKISSASLIENHPHDITITKESPNYTSM